VNEDPRKQTDALGRVVYTRKSTRAEIDRRNAWVAKLHQRGHNTVEIAVALDINNDTVRQGMRDLGIPRTKSPKGAGWVKEPCPWRDDDVPMAERERAIPPGPQETRWRQSRIIAQAQMLNDEYRESNFTNILANQVTDAEEAGDHDWTLEALATINAAAEKLERARRVLTDDSYRVACRDTLEGVEAIRHKRTQLRAVR
jgi:hypothetical protein